MEENQQLTSYGMWRLDGTMSVQKDQKYLGQSDEPNKI